MKTQRAQEGFCFYFPLAISSYIYFLLFILILIALVHKVMVILLHAFT